jgi:hypothetical protein
MLGGGQRAFSRMHVSSPLHKILGLLIDFLGFQLHEMNLSTLGVLRQDLLSWLVFVTLSNKIARVAYGGTSTCDEKISK